MSVMILAGIPLLLATVLGLLVSFIQAVTQIQDQTLPQLVKVVAVAGVLLLAGRGISAPLMMASTDVFDTFWQQR